ncbi:MAG: COX15/CtaA family protein [Gammaproteobacteria bacterium]|nr:COX15/CtaA family protein [Gammaproteobacteria bacterium]
MSIKNLSFGSGDDRLIAHWLLLCALLIFAMVILGGVTRLTGSGLSMVNWHPIHGSIPPISSEEWEEEFSNYRKSPEFNKKNQQMTVDGFKQIFYFEYSHRMLGRFIGLAFLLPFLYFYFTRKIKPGLSPRLMVMFLLGGLQGLLGWYMVKSGLVDNPQVSQYRLTAHLISAILIYGFILWTAFGLLNSQAYVARSYSAFAGFRRAVHYLMLLLVITILSGGFVAGLKAGKIFNTFPLMDGSWVPPGLFALSPLHLNFFENMVTVQFDHRLLAISSGMLLLVYWLFSRRFSFDRSTSSSFTLVAVMVLVQLTLGISTLLLHVPVWLGATHQAGALLLFTALLFNMHKLTRV